MSDRFRSGQTRSMTSGDGEVSGPRPSRSGPPTPRGRVLLALAVSVLATAAVSVPLAYQAASARDGAVGSPTTAPAQPPSTVPPPAPTASAPTSSSTPGTVPTRVLPTQLDRSGDQMVWSRSADDPASHPLEGATLQGRVVVAFEPSADQAQVTRVGFWVDRLDDVRPPEHVDRSAPFTLTEPAPPDADPSEPKLFDTTELDDGPHVVLVEAVGSDGRTVQRVTRFRVDNG